MPFFRPNPTKSTSASIRSYVKVRLTRLGARVNRSRHGRMTATGPIADTDAIPSFIGGAPLRRQQAGESEAGRASSPASRDQAQEAWHADVEIDADASGNTEEITGPSLASLTLPLSSPSPPQSDKAGEVADSIGGAEYQELLSAWWGRPKSILSDDGSVVSGEEFRGRRRQAWWDGMGKAAPRRQKKRSHARKASPYRGAASQQANGNGVSQEAWDASSTRLDGPETVTSTPATSSETIAAIPSTPSSQSSSKQGRRQSRFREVGLVENPVETE
ncbi:hypothetical protein LTR02_011265 [Friedmanniomyces endolithicus]|nr:hypothetical protein LTR94_017166 [Friedmanniomyces endolithicus]KAK0773041.1 hypothetical protein LTR59_015446 [Friedmanniomyces endolithicus]KAK0783692.1 hypothetical protein LTR75_014042 [Friedmanniomyces endolithicus]KAK0818718.1 hypothetical protein LTR38_000816 [Friedmanniomyces endolithicus]KAK0835130.1 hypothetical protein LTR03_014188 [Friedmanniomyces endolithicus]